MIIAILQNIDIGRIICSKQSQKNRVLVTYDNYKNLSPIILENCNVHVYIESETRLEGIVYQFHDIDFMFEQNTSEDTFIIGLELIEKIIKTNHIDRLELYSNSCICLLPYLHLLGDYEPDTEYMVEDKYFKSWKLAKFRFGLQKDYGNFKSHFPSSIYLKQ